MPVDVPVDDPVDVPLLDEPVEVVDPVPVLVALTGFAVALPAVTTTGRYAL